jgi:hypothetical protein
LSMFCTAVFHVATLNQRSEDRVNGGLETREGRKTIW